MSKVLNFGKWIHIVDDAKNNFLVLKINASVKGENNQIVVSDNDEVLFRDECGNISSPSPTLLELKVQEIQGFIDSTGNQFQTKLVYFSTELDIDYKVNASDGAKTVTLIEIVEGQEHKIGKIDAVANSVTLVPENGLINGQADAIITTQFGFLHVKFDGVNWFVV